MVAIRKIMAVMLMGLAFTAAQVESDAQTRRKEYRKPAATANHGKPTGSASVARPARPGGQPAGKPDSRPVRPDIKPGGQRPGGSVGTRPSGPAAKPPGTRPTPPSARPSGPVTKPGVHSSRPAPQPPRPDHGYKPAPRPGAGPGYRPAPRPPRPPKPVIVTRPIYGSIIAAAVATQLIRSAVRSATRPVYYRVEANGLRLSHSYVPVGTEYYYQDGVFYIIDTYGQYRTIVPPTGALVQYLPDDYTTFRRSGELFYRVDDTVYALTLIDGNPYFEVLGQL